MAELFEEVVALLESRSATRSFVEQFRIESAQAASNGAVLGVPIFLTALDEWAADSARSVPLLRTLRSVDTTGLQDLGAAVEGRRHEPLGSEVTDMLLGDRRQQVAAVIAGEAGISERSADCLLPPTAWAVMASIADRYGSRIDRQSLMAILSRERGDLIDGGWSAWLEATGDAVADPPPYERVALRPEARATELSTGTAVASPATAEVAGGYPPPVARSARLVEDRPQALPRPATRPGNGGRTAVVTGPVSHRRPPAGRQEETDTEDEPMARRLPAIIAIALLFLLGAALVYWLLRGRNADDTAAVQSDEVPSVESSEVSDVPTAPADVVALDIPLFDPQGLTAASGVAELRFDETGGEICYNVNAAQIETPFDGHIRSGGVGLDGEVVVDFGPLNNTDIGCVDVAPATISAVLADQAGHYVGLRDPSESFVIRGQLSDAIDGGLGLGDGGELDDPVVDELVFDPGGGGVVTVVEPGQIVLQGEVADQTTYDLLEQEYADAEELGLVLINDMTIVAGSPPPTGKIRIDNAGLFAVNSDQLDPDGGSVVADVAALLDARPTWLVTVVGYTDSTGEEEFNIELSQRRAESVLAELVELGVPEDRLIAVGLGPANPIADNETSEGQARNRRIEFEIDRQ